MVTLPDQTQLDAWLAEARQTVSAAHSMIDVDDVEVRIHAATNQVEVIVRNATKPGMADGTVGTPEAPDGATTADENANTELAKTVANGFRDLGGDVETSASAASIQVYATFTPDN